MKKNLLCLSLGLCMVFSGVELCAQDRRLADSLVNIFLSSKLAFRHEVFYQNPPKNYFKRWGQDRAEQIRYLLEKIRPYATDLEYIRTVMIIAKNILVYENDLEKSLSFYEQTLSAPFADPCSEGIKKAEIYQLFIEAKQYEKALDRLEQAILQLQNYNCYEAEIEYRLQQAIQISVHQSNEKAVRLIRELAEFAEKKPVSSNKRGEVWSYLGNLNYAIKNYPRAAQYWQKATEHYSKSGIGKELIGAMNNIALATRKQGFFPEALMIYDSALFYAKQVQDTAWVGIIAGNMGDIEFEHGNYSKAIPLFELNIRYNLLTSQWDDLAMAYPKLARCFVKVRQFEQAKNYLDSLDSWLAESKRINYVYGKIYGTLIQTYKNQAWAEWYSEQGKYAEAYRFQQKYIENYIEHEKLTNQEHLSRIQTELEVERKGKENLVLKQQTENDYIEIQRQKILNMVVITFLVFFIGVAIIFYRMMKQRQKLNRQLLIQKEEINSQKEELHQQNSQLEQVNSTKNRLFAIISHDLRSPINNLKGVLEILDMDLPKEQQKEILQDTSRLMDNTFNTLENLLHWAKWQMNGAQYFPQQIDIQEISYQICSLFSQTAASKRIELANQITEATFAWADRDQIELILRNLVGNALKFTPQGGKVWVQTKNTENGLIQIFVSDNGVGMTSDRLVKLFDNQQISSTRGTAGEKGTGLGLLMCKEFAEQNGGTLTITSKIGEGTVFCVSLPKK